MGEPSGRRSELQALETTTGLLFGVLVFVAVRVGVWLASGWLGLAGLARSQVSFWGQVAGVVAGVAVLGWWLVRARRRQGL